MLNYDVIGLTIVMYTSNVIVSIHIHVSLVSFLWDIGKQDIPDVTSQNAASHLGLLCLLTRKSSKIY